MSKISAEHVGVECPVCKRIFWSSWNPNIPDDKSRAWQDAYDASDTCKHVGEKVSSTKDCKHSPKPWKRTGKKEYLFRDNVSLYECIRAKNGDEVAWVPAWDEEKNEPNACLIEAAPEHNLVGKSEIMMFYPSDLRLLVKKIVAILWATPADMDKD